MINATKCFWGIDCSSKAVHVAIISPNEKLLKLVKFSNNNKVFDIRLNNICDQLDAYTKLTSSNIQYAAIEQAIYIQNFLTSNMLGAMITGVARTLYLNNVKYCLVHNKQWKAEIIGNGNVNKKEIMTFAENKWGVGKFKEQDWADSAVISIFAKYRFGEI